MKNILSVFICFSRVGSGSAFGSRDYLIHPYLPKTVKFSVILTGGLENFNPHLGGFSKLGIPYLIATGGM